MDATDAAAFAVCSWAAILARGLNNCGSRNGRAFSVETRWTLTRAVVCMDLNIRLAIVALMVVVAAAAVVCVNDIRFRLRTSWVVAGNSVVVHHK